MTDKKLRLEIEAQQKGDGFKKAAQDAKDTTKAIEQLEQAAVEAKNEFKETDQVVTAFSQEILDLDEAVRKSGRAFEAQKAIAIRLKTEYKAMRQEGGHTAEEFENLSKRIDVTQEAEAKLIGETRDLLTQLDKLQTETGQNVREVQTFNDILDNAEGYITGMGTAAKTQSKNLNRIGDEVHGVGEEVEKAGRKIDDLGDRTERAAKMASVMSSLYTKGLDLIQDGLREATRAAIAFVNDSNQAFSEFDAGARQIFTLIPNLSEAAKKELSQDAIEMGKELGRLPDEMLPALYQALSLGIPQNNILDEVAVASEAARAGNAELEQTLVTGQSIVNAYGADVYDLGQVYDVLFTVVKNGAVTFDDLNSGMSAITSVAGEAHVPLEDIGAAIITMTKQGDSFAEVSSIMSNVLGQLAIEGSTAGAAFKEIAGVSFTAFMDQGHSFTDALNLMDDAAKAAGISILQMVGGDSPFMRDIEAARGLAELTGRHIEEMGEASNLTYDSMGTMAEAANEVAGSMEMVEAEADAAAEALKITLGASLADTRTAWLEAKIAAAEYWTSVFEGAATARSTEDVINGLGDAYKRAGASSKETTDLMRELDRVTQYWSKSNTDAATAERILIEADRLLREGFDGTTSELYNEAAAAAALQAAIADTSVSIATLNPTSVDAQAALSATTEQVQQLENQLLNVTEVLDGDTLKFETVDGEIQTLRFRNINTAEIDHGEGAMPFGEDALAFTQEWVDSHPIEIGAELDRESYGRIIASVPDLEEALIREGLAIPLPATLSDDPEKAAEFQALVMEAAAAGAGMFEDQELAARVLGGELVDLGVYYEEMALKEGELKAAYQSTIGPINELMDAQQELADAQGAGAEAAQERVTTAQEAIQQSYAETAIAAFEAAHAGEAGALENFLALQVELGNISQETADARIEMANMTIQAELLGGSLEFAKLTTGQQANAIQLLSEGYAETAEQAIAMAGAFADTTDPAMIASASAAETLYDPLHRIGTEGFNTIVDVDTAGAMGHVTALQNEINNLHDRTLTITLETKRVGGQSFEDFMNNPTNEGRAAGGDVYAGSAYRVGEYNQPEFLKTPSGLFMIPGEDGRVFNNQDSRSQFGNQKQASQLSITVLVQPAENNPDAYSSATTRGVLDAAETLGLDIYV